MLMDKIHDTLYGRVVEMVPIGFGCTFGDGNDFHIMPVLLESLL